MPQMVLAEETTRFLREFATSADVLKIGLRIWPVASTTPTPTPARRDAAVSRWRKIKVEDTRVGDKRSASLLVLLVLLALLLE